MFDRLVGLETEYAIRFHPREGLGAVAPQAVKRHQFYRGLILRLGKRLPLAAAHHFKEGMFLANGGAVWFETERPASGSGLIEGATPECRTPREVIAHQRAQDRLLGESAIDVVSGGEGEFRLIKNDRDAQDNIYGAQENYEAIAASGASLFAWRAGLVLLFPLVVLTRLGVLLLVLGALFYFLAAGVVYLLAAPFSQDRKHLAGRLFGRGWTTGDELSGPTPIWLEAVVLWLARLVTGPLAMALVALIKLTIFRRTRRELLPFLISRPIIAGAGCVDQLGRFHIADKSPAMNCVVGLGGFVSDRPIFTFGHFFKAICIEGGFTFREYAGMFAPRQRLQIAMGDSNMCQVAEYLRVGATMLVLDCLEAGELPRPPSIRRPIAALRSICADPSLAASVVAWDGGRWTAIELQRFYLNACRAYVDRRSLTSENVRHHDALDLLERWQDSLDALETDRRALIGSIDWVTKEFLMAQASEFDEEPVFRPAATTATLEERQAIVRRAQGDRAAMKKIDIKYHELSPEGYFNRLAAAGMSPAIVSDEEIERATRNAPPNTPATTRARYIREFAGGPQPILARWDRVILGRGRRRRVISLKNFSRRSHSDE